MKPPDFEKALLAEWTDFLTANPDDITSPEEYPNHALVTFDQMLAMVNNADATLATKAGQMSDEQIAKAKAEIEKMLSATTADEFERGVDRGLQLACWALGWTVSFPSSGQCEILTQGVTI